jgi:hypothetical protein
MYEIETERAPENARYEREMLNLSKSVPVQAGLDNELLGIVAPEIKHLNNVLGRTQTRSSGSQKGYWFGKHNAIAFSIDLSYRIAVLIRIAFLVTAGKAVGSEVVDHVLLAVCKFSIIGNCNLNSTRWLNDTAFGVPEHLDIPSKVAYVQAFDSLVVIAASLGDVVVRPSRISSVSGLGTALRWSSILSAKGNSWCNGRGASFGASQSAFLEVDDGRSGKGRTDHGDGRKRSSELHIFESFNGVD